MIERNEETLNKLFRIAIVFWLALNLIAVMLCGDINVLRFITAINFILILDLFAIIITSNKGGGDGKE